MRTAPRPAALAVLVWSLGWAGQAAQAPASVPVSPPALSCGEIEAFLKSAKIAKVRELPVGVTMPSRATLTSATLQHDASIQTIDMRAPTYETSRGTEVNFRDTWQFNVAGYELAKMLQLNMVPPYVERTVAGVRASVSWWIDDAIMERDRVQKKLTPPDVGKWNDQMHASRLFHELIGDADFNATNTLITRDWRIWMIDFSRAFRAKRELQYPGEITRIDRRLLENLRALSQDVMRQKLGRWLTRAEIDAVLARRDLIVRALDAQIAGTGASAVLYDLPRVAETCGTGLS